MLQKYKIFVPQHHILHRSIIWIGADKNRCCRYAKWAPNEPRTNECVQLWKAFSWQWDDTYCDLKRHFVCEDQGNCTKIARAALTAAVYGRGNVLAQLISCFIIGLRLNRIFIAVNSLPIYLKQLI